MNFSVVLIARNESKTLPILVESLKEFQSRGGEIVVLDTGSTDDTVKIARDLGCYVKEVQDKFRITIDKDTADTINAKYVVEGENLVVKAGDSLFDYASARNYAATLASNDMIATPDCDELYTKLDLDTINSKIEAGTEQFEYQFVFAHDAIGKSLIQFLHSKFYNRKALKWVGIIHEVLSGNAKREYLPESIIKLEHYQNVETDRNGYLTGLALDCYKNPDNDRNAHYFARELMYKNRFKSAIKVFQIHIDMDKWPEERSQSMLYIGDCHNYLGNTDEMFKWYLKAMDVCPDRREPLMKLAELYYKKNSPKHVIIYAEAALIITGSSFYGNYQSYYNNLPHELLYWAYWYTGNKAKSKEHYDICYSMQSDNPKYIKERNFYYPAVLPKVSIVIPSLERPLGLKKCLDSIKKLNYPKELIETLVKEGPESVPKKMINLVEKSTGEYIIYAANDIEFESDSVITAIRESIFYKKRLVAFDTGVRNEEGYICEHFLIKKDLIPEIGGNIFDTDMNHVGVDDLLWKKCDKLNETMISKGRVKHYHFSRLGSDIKMDNINKKAWKTAKSDRNILKKKLEELV